MTTTTKDYQDSSNKVFSKFVKTGHYEKDTRGLYGKYDNVRKYWEDKITQYTIRPHLSKLIEDVGDKMRRIEVCDLGSGTGEGYELLTNTEKEYMDIQSHEVDLLGYHTIGRYTGVDLSPEMVERANEIYSDSDKLNFRKGDLSKGLPLDKDDPPYDLYYSSYGSLSHIDDDALKHLLVDIARHAKNGSVVVGDWLGRYSYEWPCYWEAKKGKNQMREYTMSWIDPSQEKLEEEKFPLRFWSREELEALITEVEKEANVKMQRLTYTDRSVFTGRHMDTAVYNPNAQPIRRVLNSLHADNVRTDLTNLIIDYTPKRGYEEQNRFFEELQVAWNTLVEFTIEKLKRSKDWKMPARVETMDLPLKQQVKTMDRVIENVGWMKMGDPRANIIEPQLGYALRELEMSYQQGKGMAHAILGLFKVVKE